MTVPPADSQPEYGADSPRGLRVVWKVAARVVIISVVVLALIAFLFQHRASPQPYLRMEGLLKARIASYHPLIKWVNGDTISEEISTIEEAKKASTKELSLAVEIDMPLRPATRGVLSLWIREYPDVETAAKHFAWLEKSGVRRTAAQSTPLVSLPNPHGFDKLGVDTNAVVGLLGRRHFEITTGAEGMAGSDLSLLAPLGSSGYFIQTGVAAMMLDIWRQAQGLPHTGLGLPFPPHLSGLKENANEE